MKTYRLPSILLIFSLILINACSTNPVTGKKDLMLISKDQEVAMGKESDPEIVGYFGLYEDEKLQKFIEEQGQKMAALSHRPDLTYEFKIVDSPVVNAFAVPGGYVYFTRGIMAHFNNEAEFAGVLGHEIGHIAARHSAKQYSKSMLAQVGLAVGMIVSPTFRQFADVANTGVQLLFLKFGRDAEEQSDKLGVEYSSKIGYDAHEMAGFFNTLKRLQEESGQSVPTFLSTHPDPKNRLKDVGELATKWQQKLNLTNPEVEREAYLRMIDGIIYGEDPKQGYVENNVFYHPVMKFEFPIPRGWTYQNTPQQVQMAPQEGNALMILTLSQEKSLEAAAQAVLQNYQLTLVESEQGEVNGMPALAMVADQQQEQQTIRVLSYLINYNNTIYNFLGVSSVNDFNQFTSTFNQTMQNFDQLTDPSKLNVQPYRVRIKTIERSGTLAQALQQHSVEKDRMEEVAVINGMSLEDKVEKGALIKVIEREEASFSKR